MNVASKGSIRPLNGMNVGSLHTNSFYYDKANKTWIFLPSLPQIPLMAIKNIVIIATSVDDTVTVNKNESISFHFFEERNRAIISNNKGKLFQL